MMKYFVQFGLQGIDIMVKRKLLLTVVSYFMLALFFTPSLLSQAKIGNIKEARIGTLKTYSKDSTHIRLIDSLHEAHLVTYDHASFKSVGAMLDHLQASIGNDSIRAAFLSDSTKRVAASAIIGIIGSSQGGTGQSWTSANGLPTINSGIWNLNSIITNGVLLGGTNNSISSTTTGMSNQILRISSGGATPSFGAINLSSPDAVSNILDTAYTSAKLKRLIAGPGISLSPSDGIGDVLITINDSVGKAYISDSARHEFGDISSVVVSTPLTGGGTSGSVVIAIDTSGSNGIATLYQNGLKLSKSDTLSLSNRIDTKLSAIDTTSLSVRINTKLSAVDTASLSSRITLKLNSVDTASLSNRVSMKLDSLNNLQGGGAVIYKTGTKNSMKRLKAGTNVTITDNSDSVTIATSGANTALSNLTSTSINQPLFALSSGLACGGYNHEWVFNLLGGIDNGIIVPTANVGDGYYYNVYFPTAAQIGSDAYYVKFPLASGTVVVTASSPLGISSAGDISLGTVPETK